MNLASVPTAALVDLERALQRGALAPPLSRAALAAAGLGELAAGHPELLAFDRASLLALLGAVIAERAAVRATELELVWTGPEAPGGTGRDTAVVVRELFASARHTVLVAGFRFDHGTSLLEPLHRAMAERRVRTTLCLDDARAFVSGNWPFGPPYPDLFSDARGRDAFASLHAKCVVVDEEVALITSANFTDRGQSRNFEVGVLVHQPAFAVELARQWNRAIAAGHLVRATAGAA